MNATRKLWLAVALAALLAATFAACGGDDSGSTSAEGGATAAETSGETETASDEEVNVGLFILAAANSYSQQNKKGAEEAAEKLGNATVTTFDGGFEGGKQATQIQDAVASGKYNAFVIFPNDGAVITSAVEEAAEAGIKTVAAYAPIGTDISTGEPQVDGVVGTVWHPNVPNGELLGELTVEACEQEHADANPCKVYYISGGKEIAFEVAKQKAFEEVIGEAKQAIEVVGTGEGGFLVDPARTATEDMLQANSDVNVITTSGDQMTMGAEQALDDAGVEGVTLIGNGASTEAVEAINAGRWFGSPPFLAIDEGRVATEEAIESVRGVEPKETDFDVLTLSPVGGTYTKADEKVDFTPQWSINQ